MHNPPRPREGNSPFHKCHRSRKGCSHSVPTDTNPAPPTSILCPIPESEISASDESFQSVAYPSNLLVSQGKEPNLLSILLDKTFHTALKVRSGRPFLKPFPSATKLLSKLKRKPAYIAHKRSQCSCHRYLGLCSRAAGGPPWTGVFLQRLWLLNDPSA